MNSFNIPEYVRLAALCYRCNGPQLHYSTKTETQRLATVKHLLYCMICNVKTEHGT